MAQRLLVRSSYERAAFRWYGFDRKAAQHAIACTYRVATVSLLAPPAISISYRSALFWASGVARRMPPPTPPKCWSSNVSLLAPPSTRIAAATPAGRRRARLLAPPAIRMATTPIGLGSRSATSLAPPVTVSPLSWSPRRSAVSFETPSRMKSCQGIAAVSVITAAWWPHRSAYLAHSASERRRYWTITEPLRA